jgi:hypothetical protein
MHLITFQSNSDPRLGVIHQGTIIDLQAAHAASEAQGPFPDSMVAILSLGETGLQMAGQALSYALEKDFVRYDRKDVTLLPPVPRPGKVMALGKNYIPQDRYLAHWRWRIYSSTACGVTA